MDYPHQPYIGDVEHAPGGPTGTAVYPSATMYEPKLTRMVGGSAEIEVETFDTPQIICSPILFKAYWRYDYISKTGRKITEVREYRPYVVLSFQTGGRLDYAKWKNAIIGNISGIRHAFGETGVTTNQRFFYYPYGQIYRAKFEVVIKSMDEIEAEFIGKRYQGYEGGQIVLLGVKTTPYPWLPFTAPIEIPTHAGLTMGTMHL